MGRQRRCALGAIPSQKCICHQCTSVLGSPSLIKTLKDSVKMLLQLGRTHGSNSTRIWQLLFYVQDRNTILIVQERKDTKGGVRMEEFEGQEQVRHLDRQGEGHDNTDPSLIEQPSTNKQVMFSKAIKDRGTCYEDTTVTW